MKTCKPSYKIPYDNIEWVLYMPNIKSAIAIWSKRMKKIEDWENKKWTLKDVEFKWGLWCELMERCAAYYYPEVIDYPEEVSKMISGPKGSLIIRKKGHHAKYMPNINDKEFIGVDLEYNLHLHRFKGYRIIK